MKNTSHLKHFLIIFLCIIQLSNADSNLISETCLHTPDPNLCITTYNSNPASAKADLYGLAKIGSDILLQKASSTKANITTLLKNASLNKEDQLVRSLNCSAELYDMIINYDLPEINEAVTKGDPKFGQDAANDIALEADTCEKCFLKTSPIYDQNKFVHDFSLVLSAIIQMLL
ncbi:hypothetical protein ACFE04_007796 [Oxalis oulophora]